MLKQSQSTRAGLRSMMTAGHQRVRGHPWCGRHRFRQPAHHVAQGDTGRRSEASWGKVAIVKADNSLYETFALWGRSSWQRATLHKGERGFYDQAGPMPTPSLQFGFKRVS